MSKASETMRRERKINDAKRDAGLITPDDIERADDIQYGPDPVWNKLDVYRPKEREDLLPVIVSIHGGGWVYGDKELYQFYCMSLAQRGFGVINFTYRLAPEVKYPAPFVDTNLVMEWLVAHGAEYGLDLDRVFMVGDSAGAHILGLYTAILTDPDYATNYPFKTPEGFRLRAIGLNCGAYEVVQDTPIMGSEQDNELMGDFLPEKGSPAEKALINVTDHVNPHFPPVYLMSCIGDFCLPQFYLFRPKLEENKVYCESRVYGDEEHPLYHVFHLTVQEETGQQCNDDEVDFFRRMMA